MRGNRKTQKLLIEALEDRRLLSSIDVLLPPSYTPQAGNPVSVQVDSSILSGNIPGTATPRNPLTSHFYWDFGDTTGSGSSGGLNTDPLTAVTLGSPGTGSSSTVVSTGSSYTLTAGTGDFFNGSDNGEFDYKSDSTNFDYEVQVTSLSGQPTAHVGIMARTSTASDAAMVMVADVNNQMTGSSYYTPTVLHRANNGDTSTPYNVYTDTSRPTAPNLWLRLSRSGSTFTGYYATTSAAPTTSQWNMIESISLAGAISSMDVGLALSNPNTTGSPATASATIANFGSTTGAAVPLTPVTLGTPGTGSSSTLIATGTSYTLTAGTGDFFNGSDNGQFDYKTDSTNFDYEVQVTSLTGQPTAHVGIMARTSTASDAAMVMVADVNNQMTGSYYYTPTLLHRDHNGDTSTPFNIYSDTSRPTPPNLWLRLTRSGSTFTGYYATTTAAPTTSQWTMIESVSLAGAISTMDLGLALSNPNTTGSPATASATFANFGSTTGTTTTTTGAHNTMEGYTAAHIYNNASVSTAQPFTITLTVVDPLPSGAGTTSTAYTSALYVGPNLRTAYHVALSGNDSTGDGSPTHPFLTASKAISVANGAGGSNYEILFNRGDTFPISASLAVTGTNVVIGAYPATGTTLPILQQQSGTDGLDAVTTNNTTALGVVTYAGAIAIEDIAFDSVYATGSTTIMSILQPNGGMSIALSGCKVVNLYSMVNTTVLTTAQGVFIADNTDNGPHSMSGYLLYGATGNSDFTIVGNTSSNSLIQHTVRIDGADFVTIDDNDFVTAIAGTLTMHYGSYFYVSGNKLGFVAGIGPLGQLTTDYTSAGYLSQVATTVVFDGNRFDGSNLNLTPGINGAMLRNNTFSLSGGDAILLTSTDYLTPSGSATSMPYESRTVQNVHIVNNSLISPSATSGAAFLQMNGPTATGQIVLANNLVVEPGLTPSVSSGAAALMIFDNALDAPSNTSRTALLASFSNISNNVFALSNDAQGNDTVPASTYNSSEGIRAFAFANDIFPQSSTDWQSYDEFDADSGVSTNYYEDEPLFSSSGVINSATSGTHLESPSPVSKAANAAATAGAATALSSGVFSDLYGNTRSTGLATAGAVQVTPWTTSAPAITAAADTFVSSASPTTNYSTQSTLQAGHDSSSGATTISYISFDVSSLTSPINEAVIQLTGHLVGTGASANIQLIPAGSFNASSMTYSSGQPTLSTSVITTAPDAAGQPLTSNLINSSSDAAYRWDVTKYINSLPSGTTTVYFALVGAAKDTSIAQFYSQDYTGTASARPQLLFS